MPDTAHATPAADQPTAAPQHHIQIHAPRAGATASLLNDYIELFKVRVTGLVVMTAWAGFYLGSIRSGVSSVQPVLVEALLGIGLVSAGSSALNQAIERKLDAKMIRTAQRPMAAGRISLAHGIAVGLAGAFAFTRLMRALLFHVSSTDPATYAGIAVLFLLAALAASYIPARRATRIDPMAALRVG